MNKQGISKSKFLPIFFFLIAVGFLVFVLAVWEPYIQSPVMWGNYSGTMKLYCNSSMEGPLNATIFRSAAGGGPATTNITTLLNTSANETTFNTTLDISAIPSGINYNFTCVMANQTNTVSVTNRTNITIDNTAPAVTFSSLFVDGDYINNTFVISTLVVDAIRNVTKGGNVFVNVTTNNVTASQVNFLNIGNLTGGINYYNLTISNGSWGDGKYNITIYANDSNSSFSLKNAAGAVVANQNITETLSITIDTTSPTANYSCNPTTLTIGQEVTCTCTGTDVTAGINYTSDGDTTSETSSVITKITTRSAGTFSRSCTVRDRAGNAIAAAATASYTVSSSTGSSTGSTSTSGGTPTTSVNTIGQITTTSPATVSNFVSGSGVSEIQVQVTSTASNVKITVNKYESAPAAVTVSLDNSYKYLQINTQNLADKLSKATIKTYVEKSWVTAKGIDKEEVSLYKYDESADQWNELTTTYASEDATYYYYNTEVASFSYFGLAPASAAVVSEEETPTPTPTPESTAIPAWVWIVIGVVILAAIIGGGIVLKKRKR